MEAKQTVMDMKPILRGLKKHRLDAEDPHPGTRNQPPFREHKFSLTNHLNVVPEPLA